MRYQVFLTAALLALISADLQAGEGETDDLVRDRKQIQGTWDVVGYDLDGRSVSAKIVKKMGVVIQADKLTISPKVVAQRSVTLKDGQRKTEVKFTIEEGKNDEARYRLDTVKNKKVIELTQDAGRGEVRKITALYALQGDSLTICIPLADRKLPKKIPDSPTAGVVRIILKRAADTKAAPARPDGK